MNNICIVGSNSFSGASFAKFALKQGANVVGISRSKEANKPFLPYKWEEHSNFSFYSLDLNQNLKEIIALINDLKPTHIVNFAAQSMVGESWLNPSDWFMTNVVSTINFHDNLRKCDFLKRYIHISTPEVYGSTSDNLQENHNYSPSTPYAASKLAGDLHLITLYKRYDFPVIFTRSANVYGIHQQLYRIIPRAIIYLKMKRKIQLHGNGKSERSFIHIRDVVNATLKIAEKGTDGDVYHISPEGDDISIYAVVKVICEMMNHDFKTSVELIDQNFGQDSKYSISSSKLREELNWRPKILLETGIEEMINWIDNNWAEISKMPLEYIHKK